MNVDAQARRIARTVFDRPVSLAAGAGTGKTATLVARLVTWLVGPGWEDARSSSDSESHARIARVALRGSVAITFTEAAAAEMHERLTDALARLAGGDAPTGLPREELPPEAKTRAAALRDALEEPVAITIHSFARGLLGRFPLEAGLQPGFAVDADGRERERVVRELVEETLAGILAQELDPSWTALFREKVAPQDLGPVLLGLCEQGASETDLARPRYDAHGIARWKDEFGAALEEALETMRALASNKLNAGKAYAMLEQLLDSLHADDPGTPAALEEWVRKAEASCPKNLIERIQKFGRADFGRAEEKLLGDDAARAARACAALHAQLRPRLAEHPQLFEHARALLGPLLAEVRRRLRAANVLGFQDLLREARELLRNPRVRRALQAEIRQLSVDEFQDTDALQCELIAALALEPDAGDGPALFLVGDPKQSIYAWRSADLAAYEGFLDDLAPRAAARAELTRNFRSSAAVLEAVERWVAPSMVAEAGLQPSFQALFAHRTETPAAPALEFWVPWDTDPAAPSAFQRTSSQRSSEIEAAMLARDLERLALDHVPWKDCAVLVRNRTHIPGVLEALRARGIPHEVSGDRSYYRRREVVDALAWIAAAIDPGDQVALLGALRSSACGLPDAALPALWAEGFPVLVSALRSSETTALAELERCVRRASRSIPREVGGRALPAGWEESLLDALATLGALREAREQRSLAEFFECLRTRTLFEALESARYQGEWRAENLERLYARLARWLEERHGDFDELLALVREDLAQERDMETARPEELETDAVRVMTIHGAKGLEFRHVYLLGLGRGSQNDKFGEVEFQHLGAGSECVLFGIPGPRWHECAARRARVRNAEEVRTLYVALTRAKDRLVLSGKWPGAAPKLAPLKPNLLQLLLASAPADWYATVDAAARGSGELPSEPQLCVRLPAAADLGALEPRETPSTRAEPAPIDAAAAIATRENACAQARRPWSASPSHLAQGADDEPDEGRARLRAPVGREAGSALHRALERWDFQADPDAECARLAQAEPAARALLERFAAGPLLPRFLAAGRALVARELAFVAAPGSSGASCALSGSMDLVYRDEDGRLVVVDYKSDVVEGVGSLEQRARHHEPQLRAYTQALALALPHEPTPRAELWFLGAGAVRKLP
ncbi:MAG: UvrD-helicase domain-containing protein [Planctomycetes bacterium]|nr:UvrD-helicase domain-containing protein [Planctomycetota bacterium]